jgi:hypothetical protein
MGKRLSSFRVSSAFIVGRLPGSLVSPLLWFMRNEGEFVSTKVEWGGRRKTDASNVAGFVSELQAVGLPGYLSSQHGSRFFAVGFGERFHPSSHGFITPECSRSTFSRFSAEKPVFWASSRIWVGVNFMFAGNLFGKARTSEAP